MPYRFSPINPDTPFEMAVRTLNQNFAQLDNETVTKTFKGPNGKPALTSGRLDNGFYGTAYQDQSGNTVKLVGFDSNGVFIEITVKDGNDAYTVLGY